MLILFARNDIYMTEHKRNVVRFTQLEVREIGYFVRVLIQERINEESVQGA